MERDRLRVALIYDRSVRPDTTGEHCLSALRGPVDVAYFAPTHLDKIPSSGFDLYLHIDDGFHYTLPDALRPSAWWVIDTHITYDRDRDKATTFDFIFAAQREGAERLLADGLWPVWWLPLACNPEVHRRLEVPQDLDVAFVGNPGSPERQRLLELVQAHFPNSFIGNAYGEEMARVYSRAKVVLNRSIGRDVNMRVFEALASGSLLITNDLSDSGQADLFQDGQNLVTYRTDDELLEKIAYYLAHDGEREAIAHTGREAVLAHHTYAHRMRFILEAVSAQTERQVGEAQRRARPEAYYHFSRPDLAELMAPEGKRLLDVGCAAGRLGEELKRRGAAEVVGVELIPEVATEAKGRLDSVLVADVETAELPWPEDHFDYVICGDLLEHLRDPAAVLRKLARHLKPEGEVIASLPNIRHVAVISELAQGRWRYRMSGILDRDHLRFFTRREARELFRSAGLIVTECRPVPTPQHAQWEAAGRSPNLQLGPLGFQARSSADAEELFVEQWLLRARQHPLASVRGLASIIIPVWNQLEHTRLCLDSLREHTAYPHEIIVVDNGSDDGTPECLAEQADVTVIRNDRNEGFIKACNQGLRASAGDYLVLLNNDTVVTRGWLEGLLSIAEWDPAVGLAGPVSNNVSGPQQIPTGYSSLAAMHEWAAEYTRAHAGHLVEAERLIGFCLFIKRDLLDHIGFLDERFGIGLFDDDDLSLRTRRAGYRLVYTHGVFVHHFGNQTFQALGMDAEALLERNWEQFREKWAQDPQGAEHLGRLYVSVPRSDAAKPAQTGRRIAVVSLLFNWPSTGGGIINTVGMLRGLERAGYEVRHFYAQAAALGVGDLRAPLDTPSVPVPLGDGVPGRQQLGEAFREAVGSFRPDCVIVTDSWTCKPVLAHAAAGYPYLLRFHGLEGLCPLNGIRFVADGSGAPSCQTHLLADAGRCRDCVARHQGQTGTLHAAERAISGAASEAYVELLREALAGSAAVLVNNPLIANLLGPHAPHVSVATPGVDVAQLAGVPPPTDGARPVILFPSLWQEGIKGYSVLEEACTRLRSQGHDFEVRVAGPDPERLNEWTTCVGWYPQERLADLYGQADFVVVPSVCEEAFGIVAAEGSAAGRPVIASRIGGLQSTVEDGVTGLLFEPGNAEDLAAKLGTLLADADLRRRLGEAGRARASRRYAWDQVIRQAYEPVLARTWAEADTGRTMPTRERMASTTADATPKAKRRRRKGKKGKAKGGGRPTVSLCMIVKNEEAHLPRCLKSVAGVFDEVIIVDTGSEDRTKKIAREHGARVFDFPWIDDFSAARNASLAPATGEWVMWLDADDSLDEENRSRLRKALAVLGDSHMAYVMKVRCLPAGEEGVTEVDHVKLFRNLPQLRFEYRVHEQILPAIRRLGGEVGWTDVVITHHGYQDPAARRRKLERDQRILREELRVRPDDPFCLFNLGCIDQELGAHDEAISSLHRSIDLSSPRDSQVRKAYAMIVQMERERSRPEAALQAYDAARAHYPADPELLFQAGLTHRALGDYAGAEESFLAAMEAPEEQYFSSLDPSIRGYKARHNLAVLYLETGRPEQAEAQWREAVAEAPAFTPAWDGLCELLSRRQDWSGLRELATEAGRQARPDLARVIEARAHLVQRDFDAAVAALRAVLAADAGHETAQRLLTYALLQSGQWAEAEPALRRLVELAPDDAEARRNLAVLLHEGARQPEGSAPSTSERLRPSPPDP